eukprot:CAMPEP_0196585018 /NCGR_PEP_ID=MMETSP1081-20130531/49338_1 /TAXON_ID=36882 /ORGANISM="Pyramimonas amylifera, Strain CCMP720" /LENGTH=134 /DNA_ID=CAMNT_0041906425 /DNA_START=134 /DNA_END=538 /DNA_ORIENTATION=-
MKSVKDLPVVQDLPPPGGFPTVRYARRIPNTGPSGIAIFGISGLIMGYGFYLVKQGNDARKASRDEQYAARQTLLPLLQAEEDRRFAGVQDAYNAREAEIMKNTPGWKVGMNVYNNGKWYPPCTSTMPFIDGIK